MVRGGRDAAPGGRPQVGQGLRLQLPEPHGAAHLRRSGLRHHAPVGGPRQATDGALHLGRGQSP
eukprot:11232124-Alexandrium_andersonii.AAC.1